ncbi:MAG: PDZ domain-containing protein [Acidobacteriaceae bacterium]|nr:PDZ domain-containing protein [Acidobacteriaceae bacterium]
MILLLALAAADLHAQARSAGVSAGRVVVSGYLGVDLRDVTADQLVALKLKETRGAEIIQVDHDAPAGKAGLREHDVLLRINKLPVEGEEQVRKVLRESPPGTTLVLVVSRDGQQMTVTTQTANREEVEREAWEQHMTVPEPAPPVAVESFSGEYSVEMVPAPLPHGNSFIGGALMSTPYTGAMLETLSAQLADFFGASNGGGLLVRSVEANSPAALAGLRAGDVVVRVNAKPVASSADWTRAIKDGRGRSLVVVVLREKKEQTLTLTPEGKKRSSVDRLPENAEPMVARLGAALIVSS